MKRALVKHNKGKIIGDENVLKSPLFVEAFESVCELYRPKHNIAVFSLCTQTKPFSNSMKWRGIIKIFGSWADLIICSSAGIIPLEFEKCYPFSDYDSHSGHEGSAELSNYSKQLFEYRCKTFLTTFKWEYVIFLLDPYEGASQVVNGLGISNVKQFPSAFAWNTITAQDFIGYSLRFCKVLNKKTMTEIQDWIGQDIPYMKENDFNRNMSLLDVIKDIYEKLEENRGYSKAELCQMINNYGIYDRSYKYKVINGNVLGARDYKFYIKNNNYFIKVGKLYYKNTGKPLKLHKKLF